jgi:hypothetical protein
MAIGSRLKYEKSDRRYDLSAISKKSQTPFEEVVLEYWRLMLNNDEIEDAKEREIATINYMVSLT